MHPRDVLAVLLIVLFLIIMLRVFMWPYLYPEPVPYYEPEDMWSTTTTTTTVTTSVEEPPKYDIAGELKRSKSRNGQYFVIDPTDKKKYWLNDSDDMFEDGQGKFWKLV